MSKPSVYLLIRSSIDMNIKCVAYLTWMDFYFIVPFSFGYLMMFRLVFCLANTDSKGMSELSSLLYVYVWAAFRWKIIYIYTKTSSVKYKDNYLFILMQAYINIQEYNSTLEETKTLINPPIASQATLSSDVVGSDCISVNFLHSRNACVLQTNLISFQIYVVSVHILPLLLLSFPSLL